MKNPLSLEAFSDWLATMPAQKTYDYVLPTQCAIAQYLKFTGLPFHSTAFKSWTDTDFWTHKLPDGMWEVAKGTPRTFGAALERARMQLTSSHETR